MAHRTYRGGKGDDATDKTKTSTALKDPFSRADEIKRDMAEWRKKNRGRDPGREM